MISLNEALKIELTLQRFAHSNEISLISKDPYRNLAFRPRFYLDETHTAPNSCCKGCVSIHATPIDRHPYHSLWKRCAFRRSKMKAETLDCDKAPLQTHVAPPLAGNAVVPLWWILFLFPYQNPIVVPLLRKLPQQSTLIAKMITVMITVMRTVKIIAMITVMSTVMLLL